MELTGSRRTVHNMMFATVAWAALFALFLWSLHGGTAFQFDDRPRSLAFPAGNGLTIAIAFAVLAICARPLSEPTLERAERATWCLSALFPVVLLELCLWIAQSHSLFPIDLELVHTSAGLATRTAMGIILASGALLAPLVHVLFALERRHRARTALPTAYLYDDAAR